MRRRDDPVFVGVTTYRDPDARFTFRYPMGWHELAPTGDQEGVIVSPESENPKTWFSVLVSKLPEPAVAEDLETLRAGVDEGISQIPGVSVEEGSDSVLGNLVKFERVYTFQEDGATRKRRVWILYVAEWLMVAAYQGEDEAEFEYWTAIVNHSFHSFNLPEALWFATDRTLTGVAEEGASA